MPRAPELRGLDLALPALLALHFGAGCSGSEGDGSGAGGNPAAGAGGDGAATGSVASVGASVSASASVVGVGTASGAGGGGGAFVCDPPAEPGSIWEKTADMFDAVDPVSMCKYRGDVLLIFNGAAL